MSASAKQAADLANQMADMLGVIQVLEERLRELKQMARKGERKANRRADKGAAAAAARPARPPNAWILFTQRVKGLVVAADLPFAKVTDALKFCKELKDERAGYGWSDEEIVTRRRDWDPPTPVQSVGGGDAESVGSASTAEAAGTLQEVSACPTCKGVLDGNAEAHRACVRTVAEAARAAGADPLKAVDAWAEAVTRVVGPRPAMLPPPGRSATPLRRPSGTVPLAVPQLQRPPPLAPVAAVATLNTPSEEMVVEDME